MIKDNMILELKEKLNENKVVLSFTGSFSQRIIEEIGEALKEYLKCKDNSKGTMYKVFSVFIEQTQNVKNYAYSLDKNGEKDKVLYSSVVLIGEEPDHFFICSGNLINKNHKEKLENKLKIIKNSNKSELKNLYKSILRDEIIKENNSAGLGLYEIAKNSNQKIEYKFTEIDEYYYFFTLTAYI